VERPQAYGKHSLYQSSYKGVTGLFRILVNLNFDNIPVEKQWGPHLPFSCSHLVGWNTSIVCETWLVRVKKMQCCLPWCSSMWHPTTSQSSTQPYVWSPAHRDAITWFFCNATATGCQWNSASSTSYVWWYIAACTATHHLTWRTWSRRRLLQLSDLVSDLVHPIQLQCHELHRCSETGSLRRLAHVHGTNFHHRLVASILMLLSNVKLRHFI